jgi:predicted dienelactone hydrolase
MIDPLTVDPTTPGPYTCGHRELSTTYSAAGGINARTIPVHVWYPSNATEGDHPVYRNVFPDDHAFEGVPLASPLWKSGLPVLVHSHGHKGFAGNSARLMCHFASHGWLAVAPEHVGNTIGDTPDQRPLAIYLERPLDIRAALDLVAALPKEDPLAGKADLGHVAMSGHSFGTFTAWTIGGAALDAQHFKDACAGGDLAPCSDAEHAALAGDLSDPRPRIIIPLAGAPNSEVGSGYDSTKVPVLMMDGSLNMVGNDTVWAAATKLDLTWVDVEGGCHQLFGLGNSVLGDPACKALPDEEGFALVNPWVLAYARYHVLDDRSEPVKGLVEGTTSLSPKVHVQHEGP